MSLIQYVFLLSIALTVIILNVECQLKFDADGNILDDGLNLNLPELPKEPRRDQKSKLAKNRPKSERVMGAQKGAQNSNSAAASKDATLDELLKAAGLNSKGQKLEKPTAEKVAPKAEKVAQVEEKTNILDNLDPETLKNLLAAAPKPTAAKALQENRKEEVETKSEIEPKLAEGLGQILAQGNKEILDAKKGQVPETKATVAPEVEPNKSKKKDSDKKVEQDSGNDDPDADTKIQEGEQIELYPWQTEICKDYDEEACQVFKPMCNLMGVIAHKKCRKTCKLCLQDKPKPKTITAKLKEFSLTLSQNGPLAPSFLTVCIDSSAAQKYGLPDTVHSLIIHAYGDASEDTCENFGPHFNPYGVEHGHPEDVTKHVGDLGILEFRKVPDEWPEDVTKCTPNQIGSYGVFDHISLYGENSPCYRPVVLYKGEAPMKEFKPSLTIACDVLHEPKDNDSKYAKETNNADTKTVTEMGPAAALLSANRVKAAKELNTDLSEAVTPKMASTVIVEGTGATKKSEESEEDQTEVTTEKSGDLKTEQTEAGDDSEEGTESSEESNEDGTEATEIVNTATMLSTSVTE